MSDRNDAASSRESRPRPQYGEYASPEEQRARIQQPDITRELETGQAVTDPAPNGAAVSVPGSLRDPSQPVGPAQRSQAAQPSAPAAVPAKTARPRTVDRIITFALLAYGLINVVTAFPALVDFGAYAETMFDMMGVDAVLSDPAAGRPWGIAAALVLAVGWFITAALAWWSVRRSRFSWWIPLAGGILFTLIAGSLMLVPLLSDQAVWEALVGSVGS